MVVYVREHDVVIFGDLRSLDGYVEELDVSEARVEAFDAEGRGVTFRFSAAGTELLVGDLRVQRARTFAEQYLASLGKPPPPADRSLAAVYAEIDDMSP